MTMPRRARPPVEPGLVQDPCAFYRRARAAEPLFYWQDYGKPCLLDHAPVNVVLRDRRWGREVPPEAVTPTPPHIAPFMQIEAHSMLELEPPRHTWLRGLVLTIARMLGVPAEMADQLLAWSHDMVAMYQANRDRATEDAAAVAATEFADYIGEFIDARRKQLAFGAGAHF